MKKNLKKIIALTSVFTMLSSTIAFGAPVSSTGDSGIENDDSTVPEYLQCVIPAVSEDTYDFTIDVDRLLPTYDKDDTDGTIWDSSSNVFFSTVGTPASVKAADSAKSIYIRSIKALDTTAAASVTAFKAVFATPITLSAFEALPLKYYVWQPETGDDGITPTGAGKYTALTAANIEKFFDITLNSDSKVTAIELRANYMSGSADVVCNGSVYVDTYTEAATLDIQQKVAAYLTVDNSSSAVVYKAETANVLYLGVSGKTDSSIAAGDLTAMTGDVTASVTYTDAIVKYINTSEKHQIINKSTFPVAVSATVKLLGDNDKPHGLTFSTKDDFSGSVTSGDKTINDNSTAMYMSIVCGSNEVALKNSEAVAYYVMTGATNATNKYQSTDIDPTTGSHKYVQYESAEVAYSSVDFKIKAKANTTEYNATTGEGFDWDKYIADLTAENAEIAKPVLSVVYDFTTLGDGETTETKTTTETGDVFTYATSYEDANGLIYTVVDPTEYNTTQSTPAVTTGWADAAPGRVMTLSGSSLSYRFTENDRPVGTLESVHVDSTDRYGQLTKGNISYSNGVLSINSTAIGICGLSTAGDHKIVVVIGGKSYSLSYTK